jgi:hypothetical protein
MGRACSTYECEGELIYVFSGNSRRKQTLGRPRYRWENNIKMELKETGRGGIDLIYPA